MGDQVILFTDEKSESQAAKKLLTESSIPFTPTYGSGEDLPIAHYDGISYHRIDGISVLVDSLLDKK